MRKVILIMFSLAVLLSAFGCNTMEGLGKDIKKVGQELEEAADK
jgi:predicted small secreted protein